MTDDRLETPEDRARQRDAQRRIAAAWGVVIWEAPELAACDYGLIGPGPVGPAEYKYRTCPYRHYDDELLRADKWRGLLDEGWAWRLRPILFIEHSDGVIYWAYAVEEMVVRYDNANIDDRGGRYQMSESVHLHNSAFQPIEKGPP